MFRSRVRLRDQLDDATDSIVSNIAEGFGQQTDKQFARYLYYARSSAMECSSRLVRCGTRGFITAEEQKKLVTDADEIVRMATGLIRYLERSNWTSRV